MEVKKPPWLYRNNSMSSEIYVNILNIEMPPIYYQNNLESCSQNTYNDIKQQ